MIRYTLNCDKGHTFESWFANSAAYDKQAKRSLIACPVCNSTKVEKAIMAPRLGRSKAANSLRRQRRPHPRRTARSTFAGRDDAPVEHELRKKLKELREHIVKNADYVGPRFPSRRARSTTARSSRSIYGEATPEEAEELQRGRHRLRSAAGPAGRV